MYSEGWREEGGVLVKSFLLSEDSFVLEFWERYVSSSEVYRGDEMESLRLLEEFYNKDSLIR